MQLYGVCEGIQPVWLRNGRAGTFDRRQTERPQGRKAPRSDGSCSTSARKIDDDVADIEQGTNCP